MPSKEEKALATLEVSAKKTAAEVYDAIRAYVNANDAGNGETPLRKVAARESFTIVMDTAKRMSVLGLLVVTVYGVALLLAILAKDVFSLTGVLLNVGAGGVVVLIFVTSILYAFVRNDQKAQQEFVKFSLGMTISDELLRKAVTLDEVVVSVRKSMGLEAMPEKEKAPGIAESKDIAPEQTRIWEIIKERVIKEGKGLIGLSKIKKMRRQLEAIGPAVFGLSVAIMVALVGISLVLGNRLIGAHNLRQRAGSLTAAPQLGLNDVAVTSTLGDSPGASWKRDGAASSPEASVSPLDVIYHAPFGSRSHAGAVALSDTEVLLAGGRAPGVDAGTGQAGAFADVWKGTRRADGWKQWERVARQTGWGRRWGHQVVRLARGSILLHGGRRGVAGELLSDMWVSEDAGSTWRQVEPQGDAPPPVFNHALVAAVSRPVSGSAADVQETLHLIGGSTGEGTPASALHYLGVPVYGGDGALQTVRWQPSAARPAFGALDAPAAQAVTLPVPRLPDAAIERLVRVPEAQRTLPVGATVIGQAELRRIPASFAQELEQAVADNTLPAALLTAWRSSIAPVLVVVGGGSVWRSTDNGGSWQRVDAPEIVGRTGAKMAVAADRTLVLAGGAEAGSGLPLADVFVSATGGTEWRRVHPAGGDEGNTLRRRAHFAMVAAGDELVVMGGEATGTPGPELAGLGIAASGTTVEMGSAFRSLAASDTVAAKVTDTEKIWLIALVSLAGLLLVLLVVMNAWYYRRYYKTIPKAYIDSEKAWIAAIKNMKSESGKQILSNDQASYLVAAGQTAQQSEEFARTLMGV